MVDELRLANIHGFIVSLFRGMKHGWARWASDCRAGSGNRWPSPARVEFQSLKGDFAGVAAVLTAVQWKCVIVNIQMEVTKCETH